MELKIVDVLNEAKLKKIHGIVIFSIKNWRKCGNFCAKLALQRLSMISESQVLIVLK